MTGINQQINATIVKKMNEYSAHGYAVSGVVMRESKTEKLIFISADGVTDAEIR